MKKLHLNLDELHIDSFATAAPAAETETAKELISQSANTCHHCTRFGCPGTELC